MRNHIPPAGKKFNSHRAWKMGKKHVLGTLKKIGQKALAKGENVAAHGLVGGLVGGLMGGAQGAVSGATAGAVKSI